MNSLPLSLTVNDRAFEKRWARWSARGKRRDRRMRRRMLAVAIVVACGLVARFVAITYVG
jgi:hypothetical protein